MQLLWKCEYYPAFMKFLFFLKEKLHVLVKQWQWSLLTRKLILILWYHRIFYGVSHKTPLLKKQITAPLMESSVEGRHVEEKGAKVTGMTVTLRGLWNKPESRVWDSGWNHLSNVGRYLTKLHDLLYVKSSLHKGQIWREHLLILCECSVDGHICKMIVTSTTFR